MLNVPSHISMIRDTLERIEDLEKQLRRATRRLHNQLAAALSEHGSLLGLSQGEITTFGGTNKDEEPE